MYYYQVEYLVCLCFLFCQLLTALRFFAYGSYQQDIGEYRGSALSQASNSRCTTEVANSSNVPKVLNKYIYFQSATDELKEVRLV